MLLFKIAFRNVRRQIGGYLIYFFTVALTVSLLFSLAGLMFSKVVFAFSASFKLETALVCAFLALVLAVVSAWVLGYGCAFLLRRRKKEFGMYLTLGMKRSNIVAIFVCEMLFTFLFSLAAGLGLGMLVYQAIAAGVSAFLEADIVWADYTAGAFILTIVLVGAIFLITAAVSAGYLRFEKIANLLKGKNTKGKTVKRPHGWLVVSIISFVVLVVSVLVVAVTAAGRPGGSDYVFTIVGGGALTLIAIIFTYVGALKSMIPYLLQNKAFAGRGTRTFTLRQLSDRIGADSVLFGVIAVLLSVVVAGGNIFLTIFGTQVAQSKIDNPYTVSVKAAYDATGQLTADLSAWMEEFGEAEAVRQYTVFEVRDPVLDQYILGSSWLLRESDYYALCEMAGEQAGDLEGGALLICNGASLKELEETMQDAEELIGSFKWETNDFSVTFEGVSPTHKCLAVFGFSYLLAVPDAVADAVEESRLYAAAQTLCAVNYAGGAFDEEAMDEFFRQKNEEDAYQNFPNAYGSFFNVSVAGSFLPTLRELATPWLLIVLFVTLAFALLSMAILALKSLAAVSEDRRRYKQLYLVGASAKKTVASLITQIALYFFLPFILPILMNVPVAFICMGLNDMMGGSLTNLQVVGYAAMFTAILLLFYVVYCAVTCIVARADVKRGLHTPGI